MKRSDSEVMNAKEEKSDVFLLTKPPLSPRADLCLKLIARSRHAKIYLAGDGVYHLLAGIQELPGCKVLACREDLEARAVWSKDEAMEKEKFEIPENFYAVFIDDLMEHCENTYTF
jgi:tRNA 2-thiouridine synthesizing protein B